MSLSNQSGSATARLAAMLQSRDPRQRSQATWVVAMAAAAVVALGAFMVLFSQVHGGSTQPTDDAVEAWFAVHQSHLGHGVAQLLSFVGEQLVGVLAGVLVVFFASRKNWQPLVSVLLVTGGSWTVDSVLKELMKRPRPHMFADASAAMAVATRHGQDFSFPSGHATLSAAFYTFLLLLVWKVLTGPGRAVLVAVLVALLASIDVARMALDRHYLTDVVGGLLMGLFIALVVWLGNTLLDLTNPRPPPPDPLDA